jgi:hypothetical protein
MRAMWPIATQSCVPAPAPIIPMRLDPGRPSAGSRAGRGETAAMNLTPITSLGFPTYETRGDDGWRMTACKGQKRIASPRGVGSTPAGHARPRRFLAVVSGAREWPRAHQRCFEGKNAPAPAPSGRKSHHGKKITARCKTWSGVGADCRRANAPMSASDPISHPPLRSAAPLGTRAGHGTSWDWVGCRQEGPGGIG